LQNISNLFETSGIAKEEITKLAVSTGPGSYTGIRIGIATALGLKTGLNIPCVGVPVTEAMRLISLRGEKVVTAIPMGRNDVAYQEFEAERSLSAPKLAPFGEFIELVQSIEKCEIVADPSLYIRLLESGLGESAMASTGDNLAHYIGLAASKTESSETLEPLFVKVAQ
jgi:tRNA threonylcarbamoyladenosine biosynthesis protein TsaB